MQQFCCSIDGVKRGTCLSLACSRLLVFAAALFLTSRLVACDEQSASRDVIGYVDTAVSILKDNLVNKEGIEWGQISAAAIEKACGARRTDEVYSIINDVARSVNHHSFLRPPPGAKQNEGLLVQGELAKNFELPTHYITNSNIGYIKIPRLTDADSARKYRYIRSIRLSLNEFERRHVLGMIIDLRDNIGGNMWPMLAGIGPILGTTRPGEFISANKSISAWLYENGSAILIENGKRLILARSSFGMTVRNKNLPIALLIGEETASSGEMIALAFRGRPSTKFFGQPTAGYSSGNSSFKLSDGALLIVTTSIAADRGGKQANGPIYPDEIIESAAGVSSAGSIDLEREAAMDWLISLGQPSLAGQRP
jgi:hypothetical protein